MILERRALLFPLPDCLRDYFFGGAYVVSPQVFSYLGKMQGPQPARCVRDHPNDPWHWDGQGTWWQGPGE